MILTATVRPVCLHLARCTMPNAPAPSCSPSSYSSKNAPGSGLDSDELESPTVVAAIALANPAAGSSEPSTSAALRQPRGPRVLLQKWKRRTAHSAVLARSARGRCRAKRHASIGLIKMKNVDSVAPTPANNVKRRRFETCEKVSSSPAPYRTYKAHTGPTDDLAGHLPALGPPSLLAHHFPF